MNTYELMAVFSPSLTEDQQKKVFSSLEDTIVSRGGEVKHSDLLGKKPLAYPIHKQAEGIFGLWLLELPSEGVGVLDTDLRVNEQVIRHLLTRIKNKELRIKNEGDKGEKATRRKKVRVDQKTESKEARKKTEAAEDKKKTTKKVVKKVSKKKGK